MRAHGLMHAHGFVGYAWEMAKAPLLRDTPADAALAAGAEALFGLLHIQAHVVRAVDDAFDRAHGAGLSGFELLARLAHLHPDGASVRYLAEQVVVSPSRVSRLTEELVARGWLERAASPQDGRLSLVRLTDAGRAELADMEGTFAEALQTHLLDALSAKQLTALVGIGRALGAPHC
jgi:DNA-binding MarR family transcriptional regulator